MSALTEFLLARVAEDEAWAATPDCQGPLRWRAECEAKRRIVEQWLAIALRLNAKLKRTQGWTTLRLLALPYADHPDYREEWKS